jgi:isoleucyl-tRNA synthetase
MLKGEKGRRRVSLNSGDLSLEINQHTIPVDEVLYFEDKQLVIDRYKIDELLNSEALNKSKKYTPSTNKREDRKLATQALHQDWKDAYLTLSVEYPNKTNRWYAAKIAKMDIAKERSPGTIRKNMVK